MRSKRIKTRFDQRLIGRTSARRVERVNDLSDLARFSIQFSWKRTKWTKCQRKKFLFFFFFPSYSHFQSTPHTTLRSTLFSHRQRCVTVFEMRSIRRKSPLLPPLPRKIVLCYTKYSFLRIFITPMSSFRVEFISNFTLIPQVENRCTQFKSDVSGAISFSGRKYTARVNAFNNSLD